MIDIDIR